MRDLLHKFFCKHCKIYIVAENSARLCVLVNDHAYAKHPGDCFTWEPSQIVYSTSYEEPDDAIKDMDDVTAEARDLLRNEVHDAVYSAIRETPDKPRRLFPPEGSELVRKSEPIPPQIPITTEDLKLLHGMKIKW